MFKRVRWMGVGAAAGAAATVWAERRLRRQVERFLPAQVRAGLSARVRAAGSDVREAIEEGREAMAQREAELRAQLGPSPLAPSRALPAAGRPALRVVGDPRPSQVQSARSGGGSRRHRS